MHARAHEGMNKAHADRQTSREADRHAHSHMVGIVHSMQEEHTSTKI